MSTKNVLGLAVVYVILPFVFFLNGNICKAQSSVSFSGNVVTISTQKKAQDIHANCTKSRFTTSDGQQLWYTKNGAYFYFATSKKGNEYRKYMPKEVSAELKAKE